MEIYTNDLVDIAIKRADKITNKIGCENYYLIEDECCNLVQDIRTILYKRLSEEFKNIIETSKTEEIDLNDLYKIINDL